MRRVVAGLDRVDTGAGTGLDDGGGIIDPLRAGPVALDIDADLSLFVRAIRIVLYFVEFTFLSGINYVQVLGIGNTAVVL